MISRTVQKLLILIKMLDGGEVEAIWYVTGCLNYIMKNQNGLASAGIEKLNMIVEDLLPNIRLHFEAGQLFRVDNEIDNHRISYFVRNTMSNWCDYDPKAYIKIHNASTLKVGDKVLVTRICEDHEFGWENSWTKEMSAIVNEQKVCEIVSDDGSKGFRLMGFTTLLGFPSFSLQKT